MLNDNVLPCNARFSNSPCNQITTVNQSGSAVFLYKNLCPVCAIRLAALWSFRHCDNALSSAGRWLADDQLLPHTHLEREGFGVQE